MVHLHKISVMNPQQPNGAKRTLRVQMISDFGMGILYLGLSAWILVTKRFGNFELTGPIAYGMIGLLVIYGGFRIYRGFVAWKRRDEE